MKSNSRSCQIIFFFQINDFDDDGIIRFLQKLPLDRMDIKTRSSTTSKH